MATCSAHRETLASKQDSGFQPPLDNSMKDPVVRKALLRRGGNEKGAGWRMQAPGEGPGGTLHPAQAPRHQKAPSFLLTGPSASPQ